MRRNWSRSQFAACGPRALHVKSADDDNSLINRACLFSQSFPTLAVMEHEGNQALKTRHRHADREVTTRDGTGLAVRVYGSRAASKQINSGESALDILKKRYAGGELSKEEYETIRDDLET